MTLAIKGANEIPTCHGGLENLDEEYAYWIDEVEGEVPRDLTGTFFRNGPGRQRIGGKPYGHWFDGDGMVCAFTLRGGRVHFRNRYVRTPKYIEETQAQAIRYRGFGTQVPGGFRKNFLHMPANPANTNTVWHGGHLLALNEGGKPWALNPANLETLGEFTYDGGLHAGDVFSAHGKIHPRSGEYINFGAGIAGFGLKGPRPCLNVYRIRADGVLAQRVQVPLTHFPFCHDFALSDRYAVFFLGSIVFGNMLPVILGTRTIADQVRFDPAIPMRILVLDLSDFSVVREFETDPGAVIHFANAWEEADTLVVDGMFADNFRANEALKDVFNPDSRFNGGQYLRFQLNLKDGSLAKQKVCSTESEFPTFNNAFAGRRNEVTWTACSVPNGADSFFNAIQRMTHDGEATLLELPKGLYGSEPLFAPADNATREDDGYLLEVVYDGFRHRSDLQIYRADSMEQVAVLHLKHHVPHQFHGFFTHDVFLSAGD
ncbi:MAG: carotenoid oxygenase family protein [Pseudomonadales bacterium]|nr:carotenoid oxygenase family protein [Pseudomonadales bacterium]MCP5183799.1 carotenoid oxygenase family protein [Pseudomonadales bacterium]